ncbi:helix-turn-helix transcriptional regulator, partial [Clostridium saudiense]|nr:helix-turn-helix transcriptional regulator [Clostridium saudiense]
IHQNISQKALSKGICVASYLSRIENGELIPSEEVISIIFNRLGLTFNDSDEFLEKGIARLKLFFQKLHFNEFDLTNDIFNELESQENDYITSPLVIDYFLAKLARYCST